LNVTGRSGGGGFIVRKGVDRIDATDRG
jgi:hypothetical protein